MGIRFVVGFGGPEPSHSLANLGDVRKKVRFETVSMRELSRNPARVIDRVAHGQRLLVSRYGQPIATLQPLDGAVVQPVAGAEFDIDGAPLGDVQDELRRLSDVERALLRDGLNALGRLIPTQVDPRVGPTTADIEALSVRGLTKRGPRGGWILTGKGSMLREALRQAAGLE